MSDVHSMRVWLAEDGHTRGYTCSCGVKEFGTWTTREQITALAFLHADGVERYDLTREDTT